MVNTKNIDLKLQLVYEKIAYKAIKQGLITKDEWENRFCSYKDVCGHSFVHYLECIFNNIDVFVTLNSLMLRNREELEKRFKVKIRTPEEVLRETKND